VSFLLDPYRTAVPVTGSLTAHPVSTADLTTYTFSTTAIGAAMAGRLIVVGVAGAAGTRTVSSVTVGGTSLTYVTRAQNATCTVELWAGVVASGTTGDVVVTWSGAQTRCGVGVYALYGANATAFHSAVDTDGSDPMTASLNIPAGGYAVGVAFNANSSTFAWANLTEAYDEAIEGANMHTGASDAFATAQTGLTITCDPSSASDQALAVASWGP
jgi:hypothetical protein